MFVPPEFWLDENDERARYAHHDNSLANEGYVKFLGQVADVVAGLGAGQPRVLDFGSGEKAVLAEILRQRGFDCVAYDPLCSKGQAALRDRYDIVVLCEVIEHCATCAPRSCRSSNALALAGASSSARNAIRPRLA